MEISTDLDPVGRPALNIRVTEVIPHI
ncbi:MAG: hypothetical protein K0S78_5992, partial [Thermomicrobiales bacterium]|nr:hypothetical protein [Thermomicrobiales bacterium]